MQLCDDGHNEVCYEGWNCPACEMKEERDEARSDNEALANQIADLETELGELQQMQRVRDREA